MNTCNMFLNIQKIIIGCLIKTKNSTQTIFQGGSPWATLIFNSMFVVGVLYCVQFFFEAFFSQNPSLLSFSFPLLKLFSFYFLSSILLEISKCVISQNIGCLIKTPWKKQHSNNFSRGSPWATLIFNSMFVVGVLYCVQICLKLYFFQNPSLLWNFSGISKGCLWDFYWIPIIFLWDLYGTSMFFLWYFYLSMGVLCDSYGISMINQLNISSNYIEIN